MFDNALQFLHIGYAFYSSVFTRTFRRFNWHTSLTVFESSVLSSMDGYLQTGPLPPIGSDSLAANRHIIGTSAFSQSLQEVISFVATTFDQEIKQQQLYYHGWGHVNGVARRARLIFDTVVDCHKENENQLQPDPAMDWDRQRDLLLVSAIAHDMLQIFSPQLSPHTPRQRPSGHSEKATIDKLIDFIEQLNNKLDDQNTEGASHPSPASRSSRFSSADIAIIQEAIEATVCQYDPVDGSIYQPLLYPQHRTQPSISLVAHCLALADIGTLGIEGVTAYTQEGSLLLIEENLDLLTFINNTAEFDDALKENVRARLLKRARFEVSFAKGRLARLDIELQGLPEQAIDRLKRNVFKYLTPATIHTIGTITPTAAETPLTELLDYFQLKDAAALSNYR